MVVPVGSAAVDSCDQATWRALKESSMDTTDRVVARRATRASLKVASGMLDR
jgi:hypothetical protein